MQKTVYEDYKYSVQDTARIYVGCKYTFGEFLEEEEIQFKFRLVMQNSSVSGSGGYPVEPSLLSGP